MEKQRASGSGGMVAATESWLSDRGVPEGLALVDTPLGRALINLPFL